MSSPVTSSHVLTSGLDVLGPYHVGSNSLPSMPSLSTSVTSDTIKHTYSSQRSCSPESCTGMPGLLSSKNLIQATEDEKLVVATLATLDSGSASTLIKQDLKWIIQSRRKAEGKEEIKVEFKKPIKDELTSEEVVKRMRRRELNRLAARRSREKGQRRKEKLVEEIKLLQSQNSELANDLTFLTDQRDNIINTLRQHMKQCSDYGATRKAAKGLPRRIKDMLGFLYQPPSSSFKKEKAMPSPLAISKLYIDTTPSESTLSQSPLIHKSAAAAQSSSYSSCLPSPVVIGLAGTPLFSGHGSTASFISSPFHRTSSSSSAKTLGSSSTGENLSRLSQDSVSSLSPPSTSPRKAHSFHHSPWHEPSSSSPKQSAHNETYKEFTRPASPPANFHPSRLMLERSISCPSSSSKEQFHADTSPFSHSVFTRSIEMPPIADNYAPSHSSVPRSSSNSRNILNEQEAPLDLVVRSNSVKVTDNIIKDEFCHSSMDTWPRRSSSRTGLARGAGRRWSVDDQHSAHLFEPLNLSTRPDNSHSPSPSSSPSPSPSPPS